MKRKNKIPSFISNFCEEVSCEKPVTIPLHTLSGKKVNECFNIVPEHIATHGGKQKIGWYILFWRRVLIEAVFHCVWESPDGELFDITPKVNKSTTILFLPDSTKKYTGRQVNNIRKPLTPDKNISRFISLHNEYFRYINKGDLADHYGMVTIQADFIDKYDLMVELELHLLSKYGGRRCMATGSSFVCNNSHALTPK